MTLMTRFGCTTAVAALLIPQTALADIGANDVWQNIQDYVGTFGGEMTAQRTRSGSTESISDAQMTFTLPFELGAIRLGLSDFDLIENGDGSVSISYTDPIFYDLSMDMGEEFSMTGRINYDVGNMAVTATGQPDDITYDYSADRIGFAIADVVVKGREIGEGTITGSGSVDGMSGQARIHAATLLTMTGSSSLGAMNLSYEFANAEVTMTGSAQTETTKTTSEIVLPRSGIDVMNLAAALGKGMTIVIDTSTTGYKTVQNTSAEGGINTTQTNTSAMQALRYSFDKGGLTVSGQATDSTFEMTDPTILPFPLTGAVQTSEGTLSVPVSQGDGPQDASLNLSLSGLTIGDQIWAMFDPQSQLPRDPATVELDLSGKVRNLVNWFDFAQVTSTVDAGGMPIELNAMTLNRLNVEAAGAQLTGSGAVEFDNTDTVSYGGMPKPVGTVDLTVKGANGLLDTLTAMGLLGQEEANGARMMMSMVAKPDPAGADDTLVSHIELTEEGQVLANGMRMK